MSCVDVGRPVPRSKIFEDLFGVSGGVDLRIGLLDFSVGPDEKGNPLGVLGVGLFRRSVGEPDLAAGVGEKREVEVEPLRERRVVRDGIEADAEQLDVPGVEFLDPVAEPATLGRSTGGVGLRVEPEHDAAPAVIGEPHQPARMVAHLEVGRARTWLDHGASERIIALGNGSGPPGAGRSLA